MPSAACARATQRLQHASYMALTERPSHRSPLIAPLPSLPSRRSPPIAPLPSLPSGRSPPITPLPSLPSRRTRSQTWFEVGGTLSTAMLLLLFNYMKPLLTGFNPTPILNRCISPAPRTAALLSLRTCLRRHRLRRHRLR